MGELSRDIAVLLVLAAAFGFINHRWLKLPQTIGLVLIALAASLALLAVDAVIPHWGLGDGVREHVLQIDFTDVLMEGMLSFLLFAGALHVDLSQLANRKWAIGSMATFGLLLATTLIGCAMWLVFATLGLDVPLIYCLIFGALISPTDPVAVLGILKSVKVPASLEAKIAGESLFNDGVGVVVFLVLVAIASGAQGGGETMGAASVALLFVQEALGGVLLGLLAGGLAFVFLRQVDEYTLEIIITLALVTGVYELAQFLHTSGPIAVVVAGLLIGNHGKRLAMSERTRGHLSNFWMLIDEILNAVLFLLIGLEVVILKIEPAFIWAGLIAIPIVLSARFVAVAMPIGILRLWQDFTKGAVPVLTWGGLRGGISVALVLSLPESGERDILLVVCYFVVVFSIVVQGLTIGPLVSRLVPESDDESGNAGH
jgi:CPA1 family monovalent cation:H+ antiporter